jgi:hypothetical protein
VTSYSVLLSGSHATVLATWPGEHSDHSAAVTALADPNQASGLANLLTRMSEDAWDAAAWLDVHPVVELGIAALIGRLRGPVAVEPIHLSGDGYRHRGQWDFLDLKDLLTTRAPEVLNALSRAQRRTVADELEADAEARAEALRLLPSGWDPETPTSRVWQTCEVTRCFRNGATGPLPEGGAAWLARTWDTQNSPAKRWGGRDQLVRIEQLIAACTAHGGRARAEEDPVLRVQLVLGNEVFYVVVQDGNGDAWNTDPFAPMTVTRLARLANEELGELDPEDDDGFARLLGEWTRLVPYRR